MSVTWGDRPRPSTHPAEQYTRALDEVRTAVLHAIDLVGRLDPDERDHAWARLSGLMVQLADVADDTERVWSAR